ncbi:haloacid dehalogenase-like hydrolase-domain-containing protein [Biscogniauxia marginata]|nr:haloacid dehalogenase-like hydrolase-domain-containing protein [Biscogniauxia marginata]
MSIFLDFDGTITAEDTVGELAKFALRFQRGDGGSGGSTNDEASVDLGPQWDAVVRAYVDDHRAQTAGYEPGPHDRRAPDQEIAFLRALKTIETRSLTRVRDCALFRGIPAGAFRDAGAALVRAGAVALRPGFADFVDRRVAGGWRVYVVSVNWSAAFIEGACGAREGLAVLANEVREEDGAVLGPGILNPEGDGDADADADAERRNLTNSRDKLEVVRAVLRERGAAGEPSFYAGDSTTDLECLLAVTRGVVIADAEGSPLLQTLRRIGKDVPRVRDAGSLGDGGLAWAPDFEEIEANVKFELD